MRSWDDFLGHFGSVLLFLALQLVCLYLIVQYNERQRTIFNHTALLISSGLDSRYDQWDAYFKLEKESESLHAENARLRTQIRRLQRQQTEFKNTKAKENSDSCFIYHPAQIIRNQTRSRYNHLIVNAGQSDGLTEGMAIVSDKGVVGQTDFCSQRFCSVLPLIHVQSAVSATIQGTDYFGQLRWDGRDIRYAQLEGIPQHVAVAEGDSILTSGYSTVFPRGEAIGQIHSVDLPAGSNFFDLHVKLNVDFGRLRRVYWIENPDRDEIISVIESRRYDQN